jgi:hypothetical protein
MPRSVAPTVNMMMFAAREGDSSSDEESEEDTGELDAPVDLKADQTRLESEKDSADVTLGGKDIMVDQPIKHDLSTVSGRSAYNTAYRKKRKLNGTWGLSMQTVKQEMIAKNDANAVVVGASVGASVDLVTEQVKHDLSTASGRSAYNTAYRKKRKRNGTWGLSMQTVKQQKIDMNNSKAAGSKQKATVVSDPVDLAAGSKQKAVAPPSGKGDDPVDLATVASGGSSKTDPYETESDDEEDGGVYMNELPAREQQRQALRQADLQLMLETEAQQDRDDKNKRDVQTREKRSLEESARQIARKQANAEQYRLELEEDAVEADRKLAKMRAKSEEDRLEREADAMEVHRKLARLKAQAEQYRLELEEDAVEAGRKLAKMRAKSEEDRLELETGSPTRVGDGV